jgi:putative cell wall-binding protein
MYRKSTRIRKAAVAALAVVALSGSLFVSTAGALPAVPADVTLTSGGQPMIGQGKTAQVADVLRLALAAGTTLTAGDQLLLTVDDNAVPEDDCLAGDTVVFSALPTVTVTGTATLVASLETSGGTCGNDTLRLNVTGSGTATIDITGITYTTGAGADVGLVDVTATLNAGAVTGSPKSNAFITTVLPTANVPAKGAAQLTGGSYVISPIVLAEQSAGAADGDLCIDFATDFAEPITQPTVTVTVGSDTATVLAEIVEDTIFLDVTPSGPATASTFTISGIVLPTDAPGSQLVTIFADDGDDECVSDVGGALSTQMVAGAVVGAERLGGADRFATAELLFERQVNCIQNVVVARGDLFPDALAASYLAGHARTGILLTNSNSIPASTLNGLRNEGVRNVYLMGGTAAISSAVETQLDNTQAYDCGGNPVPPVPPAPGPVTLTVQRIGGVDRFDTARMVAEYPGLDNDGRLDITPTNGVDLEQDTAILASGLNFPDALAAGPLAYRGDNDNCCPSPEPVPLLLTNPGSVPQATLDALVNLGTVNVIVTGGTAAVSDAAVAQLTAAGLNVRRIAGANRQATAAALSTAMIDEWGFLTTDVALARGDNFADVLPGGPFAGSFDTTIALTGSPSSLSADTTAFIDGWKATMGDPLTFMWVLGGTSAITPAVVQAAIDAATHQL